MNTETIDDYEKIIEEMGVFPETAKKALAISIEAAMRNFFKASDCMVDMDTLTVNIVFVMPQHKRIIEKLDLGTEVLDHDILPVTFTLASLPRPVQKIVRPLFMEILKKMKMEDEFSIWKKQARQIIDGVIRRRYEDYAEVDLKGAKGIFKKNAWVISEESLYRTGNVMFFYISSVKYHPSGISIVLSRSSVKLPTLLFKSHLPMHHFICIRRFIGHKSIVYTDAPVRERDIIRVREKVSQELSGEIMEMRSFPRSDFN